MIALDHVSLRRNSRLLIDRLSLAFMPGRITAIVGPNGAGKSTLVNLASGELTLSAGTVTLDGQPLGRLGPQELALRRAVLPQACESVPGLTARELSTLGASRLGADEPRALVDRALERVGLAHCTDRITERLSGGGRQRAHLARVLVQLWAGARRHGPGMLLLDEPIAAQDLAHQLRVLDIAGEHARSGGAVGIVLHDLNWAAHIADRLVVLQHGRIHAEGAPEAVLTRGMLAAVYGVVLEPGAVPAGPFLLPQTAIFQPAPTGIP